MNFDRRKKKTVKPEVGSLSELYPHDLQMYRLPPLGDITLMEFDQMAMDRLKGKLFVCLLQQLCYYV